MEAIFSRPALACASRAVNPLHPAATAATTSSARLLLFTNTNAIGVPATVRHASTSRRHRRMLRIPPHPSFLTKPDTDQIIFNPPSSAPSVYHTPFKFLPKSDPRRRAALASELFSQPSASTQTQSSSNPADILTQYDQMNPPKGDFNVEDIPPLRQDLQPPSNPRHHLTKEDIEEMRRLRAEDPIKNSVLSLARRFNCSKLFVLMCCKTTPEHAKRIREREEKIRARWGPVKRAAREERQIRKEMILRGEL